MTSGVLTTIKRVDNRRTMETSTVLAALAALAQSTRLAIFRLLVQHAPDGLTAGVIAEKLDTSAATLSFHLKELHRAGLLRQRQQGRFLWYSADVGAMNDLVRYLTENCCALGSCGPASCAPASTPVAPPRKRPAVA
jgi:DNA-binding transcriptional ArsR family regulator